MKIRRLNENAIQCLISRQEMDDQGISVDDIMDDRGKAEEFLRYILQEARDEVDFVTSGEALNVQMAVMKDGDVSLMITDDQGMAVAAMLAQFKEKLKEFQQALTQGGSNIIEQYTKNAQEVISKAKDDDTLQVQIWAEMDNIDQCVRLAKLMAHLDDPDSTLYKYHDVYYIKMNLTLTKREMAYYVFAAAEYSRNMYTDSPVLFGVEEHGKILVDEHAIRDLSRI